MSYYLLKIWGGLPLSFQNANRSIFSITYKATHHKGPTPLLQPSPYLFLALSPTHIYLLSSSFPTYSLPRADLLQMLVPLPEIHSPRLILLILYEDLLKHHFFLSCAIKPFVHFFHCTYHIRSQHSPNRGKSTTSLSYNFIYRA